MKIQNAKGSSFFQIACFALLAASVTAAPARPRLSANLVTDMAQKLDTRIARLIADDPVMPVGLTQGTYVTGYGAMFMGSVNLAPMAGITPFHQTISKEEIVRIHAKKIDRVPKLKEAMQDMLVTFAASMDPIPNEEQLAIAITLFYFAGEDISGLPMQIVMHAQKKALLDARANRALLASSVTVEEF